jgi:hypothetical protein
MTIKTLSFAVALALAPALASAASTTLLPARGGDLVPQKLTAAKAAPRADIERAPVAFAWALDPAAPLHDAEKFVAHSREYWKRVSASELAAGVALNASAPGAVLRLSPIGARAKGALDAAALRLRRAGVELQGEAAFDQLADAEQLKAAGVDFPQHTLAFRIDPALGDGEFVLSLPQAGGDVLLHVFEPEATDTLSLSTAQGVVLDGDTLAIDASFASARGKRAGEIVGTVAAPNGRLFDLSFERQGGDAWRALARIDAAAGAGEGLWEVHTTAWSEDGTVQRDARTAFAAAAPGAKLAGVADVARGKGGALRVALPLQVAAASRYNVAGVLWGSDADGAMQPFAIAHSAAWLDVGTPSLALEFDAALLAKTGLAAPYELRDLVLTDQATLGTMERRRRALRFDLR